MELATKYEPQAVEGKWYQYWLDNKLFASKPDSREPYTIVIPPPNVTGVLHMGHMLNNTIQDILVRRARMLGKNVCWVPGTDHASIATEAKVVNKLAQEGINKNDITRDEFLKHAWAWTDEHGGIILKQLRKLGASCDWDRTAFTMDETRSKSVIKVFCDLYNKGLIYRGVRMVNWDPKAQTALSDEEVVYKEEHGKLYYLRYKVVCPPTPKGGECKPGYMTASNSSYSLLKERENELKRKSTNTEIILWEYLNGKRLDGYKFRRQHIINDFIVDFVCLKEKLVIEVDGGYHNDPEIKEADELRTNVLESLGYRVIRFTNDEIIGNIDGVLGSILTALKTPPLGAGGLQGEFCIVATTRPETIMGDTAMCINPNDPKNAWLKGKHVIVPLVGREIPVIEDEYVDMDFGTGCLKVTPAHDINDYNLGIKHGLESIDVFNDDGTVSEAAGMYVGQDRMDVRKQIAKDLKAAGLMEKVEDYTNKVGCSERTGVPIEPKLSAQWFLKMQHFADLALPPVMNNDIKFYPTKYKNTYRHWLENIKDWCISRQLWWGHQIPAWYIEPPLTSSKGGDQPLSLENAGIKRGSFVVAENEDEARKEALIKFPALEGVKEGFALRRESDCLDTWFSSWLWPMSVFDGINNPDNEDIKYYYPTSDLVTGPDIIFFWVARMIMAGYEYRGKMPFKNVYFTGIVRDKLGRKMSKSLGNSPDPIGLIEQYGADGVRMGMMLSAPAGNDILFDESLCEQGRNFNNKIWNSFRLIKGWQTASIEQPKTNKIIIEWFDIKLRKVNEELNDLFSKYRISEALMSVYRLFTDDFSSWYLEVIKPAYGSSIDKQTYDATLNFFDTLLKMLHPFMPFITEELWQHTYERKAGKSIMVELLNIAHTMPYSNRLLADMETVRHIVSGVRTVRNQKNISPKELLTLNVLGNNAYTEYNDIIIKMAMLNGIETAKEIPADAVRFMVGTDEFAVPIGNLIDVEDEIKKQEAQLKHLEGFLAGVNAKLANEKFAAHAPENVITLERKKKQDSEEKIAAIKDSLAELRKKS